MVIRKTGKKMFKIIFSKLIEEKVKDLLLIPEKNDNPVFRISKDAKFLYINNSVKQFAGDEKVKIKADIPENWKEIINTTWESKEAQNYEILIDGKLIYFYTKPILTKGYINVYAADITGKKKAIDELKSELDQNKILLNELQHRIKNSFNMILSMITIVASTKKNKEEKFTLQDISAKIRAVSVMYDLLYINKEISEIRLDEYLNRLISCIAIVSSQIKINKKLEEIIIPVNKAINAGLITVELVTNSIKHAFPYGKKGIINLVLKKLKNKIIIELVDNGIGIKKVTNKTASPSFGLELVDILTKQLKGKIQIKNDKGTKCRLEFEI